jgi:hypothetical protein
LEKKHEGGFSISRYIRRQALEATFGSSTQGCLVTFTGWKGGKLRLLFMISVAAPYKCSFFHRCRTRGRKKHSEAFDTIPSKFCRLTWKAVCRVPLHQGAKPSGDFSNFSCPHRGSSGSGSSALFLTIMSRRPVGGLARILSSAKAEGKREVGTRNRDRAG